MHILKLEEDFNIPSPITKISLPSKAGSTVYIKRDDLIHPGISGNKWRKLKYAMHEYIQGNYSCIVTFGGAFSNHILATALVSHALNIPCHAFIRTDTIDLSNPTLLQCRSYNMQLHSLSRDSYRNKHQPAFLQQIQDQFPGCFILPEGGSTRWAIQGIQEMAQEIRTQLNESIQHYYCALGTAATGIGLAFSLKTGESLTIVPAIKNYQQTHFESYYEVLTASTCPKELVRIANHPLDRAYAKKDMELFSFAESFLRNHDVLFDPIYTSKLMRFLMDELKHRTSRENICLIHSGGIQAWNGYFYRKPALKGEFPLIYAYMQAFNKALGQ